MIGGSVLLQGYGPGGDLALIPTIGYMLGAEAPVPADTTRLHGTDEIEGLDYRKARRKKQQRIVLAVIKRFLQVD